MKVPVDMNLSPLWVAALQAAGRVAVHWSQVGDARASDPEIMDWARDNHSVVLTHDLDFTTVLALTHAAGPSVVQIRTQRVLPVSIGPLLIRVLSDYEEVLARGAIVNVNESRARVRILPINRP